MAVSTGSHRVAFRANPWARAGWVLLTAYVIYAAGRLDFTWERFILGLDNGAKFIGRMFPPEILQPESLAKGLIESLEIAILASFLGILISLPIGLFAARNLMPAWATWPARAIIAAARSFHPVIVAIIFVKAVGFGAMAGIGALTVASVGFIGKLFAEAIEEISLKQVEAVRATGASFMNVILFGVMPQVFGRFIGFAASLALPLISSTRTCATRRWWGSWAPAALAARSSRRSSASITSSSQRFCSASSP